MSYAASFHMMETRRGSPSSSSLVSAEEGWREEGEGGREGE